jgi:hypothetical protein
MTVLKLVKVDNGVPHQYPYNNHPAVCQLGDKVANTISTMSNQKPESKKVPFSISTPGGIVLGEVNIIVGTGKVTAPNGSIEFVGIAKSPLVIITVGDLGLTQDIDTSVDVGSSIYSVLSHFTEVAGIVSDHVVVSPNNEHEINTGHTTAWEFDTDSFIEEVSPGRDPTWGLIGQLTGSALANRYKELSGCRVSMIGEPSPYTRCCITPTTSNIQSSGLGVDNTDGLSSLGQDHLYVSDDPKRKPKLKSVQDCKPAIRSLELISIDLIETADGDSFQIHGYVTGDIQPEIIANAKAEMNALFTDTIKQAQDLIYTAYTEWVAAVGDGTTIDLEVKAVNRRIDELLTQLH